MCWNRRHDPPYAVRTWHYLRLALVALVLGLVAAVLYEHAQVHCFQTPISAYRYTPARGYFVAMLLGMSVCMVCLRGSTQGRGERDHRREHARVSTLPESGTPACVQMEASHFRNLGGTGRPSVILLFFPTTDECRPAPALSVVATPSIGASTTSMSTSSWCIPGSRARADVVHGAIEACRLEAREPAGVRLGGLAMRYEPRW
jgi:hypothetical protein